MSDTHSSAARPQGPATGADLKSLRISPTTHRRLKRIAVDTDVGLNQLAERVLVEFCDRFELVASGER